MIKIILPALFLLYCTPGMTYPLILKLSNQQKQDLQIHNEKGLEFKIPPGKTAEVVLLKNSNYSIRYSPGNLVGVLKWAFEQSLNSVASDCIEQEKQSPSLSVCQLGFKKISKDTGCNNCYKLSIEGGTQTSISKSDFLITLRELIGDKNTLYPQNELTNAAETLKRQESLENLLAKEKVLAELKTVIGTRRAKLSDQKENKGSNLIVIGDQGTGEEQAAQVARDMFAICKIRGCKLAVGTGDNIYPKGPSTKDTNWEKEFVDKFVKIYSPLWHQLQLPFYLTLGNHDIGVDALFDTDWVYLKQFRKPRTAEHYLTQRVYRMNTQTQFTSSKLNPSRDEIQMWNMPASKYAQTVTINNQSTLLVSLDTNYFPAEIGKNGEPPENKEQESIQSSWLEKTLTDDRFNNVNWRVVFGHHPLFSIGRHGVNTGKLGFAANDVQDMKELRNQLLPILCKHKVDFYLAGHDHHLQVDSISCPGSNHKIVHIISGAAAKKDAESPWGEYVPMGSNAFSAKALYPEFLWGNDLSRADIEKGIKARRMLGFALIKLGEKNAKVEMIESSVEGPKLLACFTFDRQEASGPSCSKDDAISPLFLTSKDIHIVPPLIKSK